MAEVTCGEARALLRAAAGGSAVGSTTAWTELVRREAVSGTPERPTVTPIGKHVLKELELRASRCDAWTLDRLSGELTRVGAEVESLARNAEFFLTNLGPITPKEAVPYLRIVGVGLAKRREDPEELAERFRNVWGMVEVMGGDPRDQLLGAEILTGTSVPMDAMYAPMMSTVERLRVLGARSAVAAASIMLLDQSMSATSAIDRWRLARRRVPTDEAAAILATLIDDPEKEQRYETFRERLSAPPELTGRLSAALHLASQGADPAESDRVVAIARKLGNATPRPLLLAAILAAGHPLAADEMVDWVEKGSLAAQRAQIASQPAEFFALGAALVEGLPKATFAGMDSPFPVEADRLAAASTLLALHAWIYRAILDPAYDKETTAPLSPAPP